MNQCNVIAINLAKNVFQVCDWSKDHQVLFNKPLKRSQIAQFMANQPPTGHDVLPLWSTPLAASPTYHPLFRGNKSNLNDFI